jgi:hypothetical protein
MLRDGKDYISMPFVPERAALSRVHLDGCPEYVHSELECEVGTWFELFQSCSHRMASVLIVLIPQFSSSVYHNIFSSSVVIWTRTVSCHALAFEWGHGGDQWSQHSPQSRRDSNWVCCLCACETFSIHCPSRWGEEGLMNCYVAVKEISHPGTVHLRSRSFVQKKNTSLQFLF